MSNVEDIIKLRRYVKDITYQYDIVHKSLDRVTTIQDKYEHNFLLRLFDSFFIPKKYSEFWNSIKELHIALHALEQYDKAIKALNKEIDSYV